MQTNDPEIGKLLADAMRKVSKDGVITIEESKTRETSIGVVEVCNLIVDTFLAIL